MRKLIALLTVVAATAVPAVAAADAGNGAVQTVDTWTNQPMDLFYNGAFCGGRTVAGYGTESGSAMITETSNGGVHVRGSSKQTIPLYEVTGPPWDITWGAFVGTLTFDATFDEQSAPGGQVSTGGVSIGQVAYANGTTQKFQIVFRLVFPPDGPPKLFMVQILCGPVSG